MSRGEILFCHFCRETLNLLTVKNFLEVRTLETLMFVVLITFLLNLPFGWLREGVKKFSPLWFLYVHLPIPFIIALRIGLGVSWKFAPLLIAIAVLGQFVGARLRRRQIVGFNLEE